MRVDQMDDDAIAAELRKQYQVQRSNGAESQMWIAAARIIHHLTAERERRRRARALERQENPT